MQRILWIDSVRGMLILLIVLGHVLGGGIATGQVDSKFLVVMHRIIYMFHVPAFFVLTGLIWSRLSVDKNSNTISAWFLYVDKKFRRLMIPYFFFGLVSIVIYCLIVEHNMASFGLKMLSLCHGGGWGGAFRTNAVLWFLPVMFTVVILYKAIDMSIKWRKFWWIHLLISIGCLCVHRCCVHMIHINYVPFGFVMALRYVSFVVLGRCAADIWIFCRARGLCATSVKQLALIGMIAFLGLTFVDRDFIGGILGDWTSWFIMVLAAATMSLSFIAMARVLDCSVVRFIGNQTIGIMLLHKFPVVMLQSKVISAVNCAACAIVIVFVISVSFSLVSAWLIGRTCPKVLGVK